MTNNYSKIRTEQISIWKSMFAFVVLFFTCQNLSAQVDVVATAGTPAATYTTVKLAFDAVNAGTHQGVIGMTITADITDNTAAVLNYSGMGAASYSSILIQPLGARTLSGSLAAPLFDLNGADNVTINGLNAAGNSLIIANTNTGATSTTSTIRFIGGATNNIITNCSLQGSATMATGTNGGIIYFATDAVTPNGNDNNTISNNNIGPVGANLPTKGIYGNGTTNTTAVGNSGNIITNNDIHDFFGLTVTSSGIVANGGCNSWTITNNRFYQTATRTWTTGAIHRAIDINSTTTTSGAQGYTVTGNIVGYATNAQTGTYALTGSTGKFQGIYFNGITGGALSIVSNNTVASVSLTGGTSNGTSTSTPFTAIFLQNGLVTSDYNQIGSQSATGSLIFSTNSTAGADMHGIFNFSSDDWIANNNNIGGLSLTNAAASGSYAIYGLRANTSTVKVFNAKQNNIGGTVANSIQLTATGIASQVIGIITPNASGTFSLNTIRNLTTNIGTGTTTGASVIGIVIATTTTNQNISENTIYNLSNTNVAGASVVTGIQFTGSTANLVQRNSIYDLFVATTSATAEVNGIRIADGTTTYRNNMIRLGAGINNAVQVNGITEILGTNSVFHNSIFIDGSPTAGTGNSFAFNGQQTTNVRSFRNNIFFNGRSNSGATGKNYAVRVGGTAPNPAGLTVNNNVYFANGTGGVFGLFNALDVLNLAAWQTAVGQDVNSIEANPLYVSLTDLNLQLGSPAIDIAANLAVTNDFSGDSRPGLNAFYDIGADERDGIPAVINDVQATAFINPANGGSKAQNVAFAPQASFTNNGTANQSSITVRYRIVDAGLTEVYNQTAVIPVLNTLSTTTVTFPNATMAVAGVYTIFAKAELVGDAVTINDEINGTLNILGPLSGTYTVGTAGNYPSLTNAAGMFDALNSLGATSNITINIISDLSGETGTFALNELAGGYQVSIQPTGAPRTITGSINGALIKLNGADGVTINGSTTGATAAACLVGGDASLRQLTIQNTNVGTSNAVISVQSGTNGAMNNVIKNVNVFGQDPLTTLIAISLGGNAPGSAGTDNDNNRVENCSVQKAVYGIYTAGLGLANQNAGTVIKQNDLSSVGANRIKRVGILLFNENGANVSFNSIGGIDNSGESNDAIGIGAGTQTLLNTFTTVGGMTNSLIYSNKINGVANDNTYSASGIAIAGDVGGANTIYNNMITGVISDGNSGDFVSGIFVTGATGSDTRIYNNSISLSGDRNALLTPTTAMYPSYGIAITGTDPTVEIKNNIISNSLIATVGPNPDAKSYAIGMTSTTFVNLNSNYNDFVTTGVQDGGFRTGSLATAAGTSYVDVLAWGAAVADDVNSLEIAPVFLSPTDLHLDNVNNLTLEDKGTVLAAVATDIDCEARNATTPDMGADEYTNPLGVGQFESNAFKFYPNPVKNTLNLSYVQEITNLEIFNFMGQQVFAKKVNATTTQIDMSGFANGAYFVKVTAGSEAKTIKIIKN